MVITAEPCSRTRPGGQTSCKGARTGFLTSLFVVKNISYLSIVQVKASLEVEKRRYFEAKVVTDTLHGLARGDGPCVTQYVCICDMQLHDTCVCEQAGGDGTLFSPPPPVCMRWCGVCVPPAPPSSSCFNAHCCHTRTHTHGTIHTGRH